MNFATDQASQTTVKLLTVLLVDDDRFIHEMMDLFLGKTEFSLISATNVEDAMRIIVSDQPDIVITDAMMPGESGFSLIEKMKARPKSANIPVILWTMMEYPNGSVMDLSGKADILVNKPFYHSNILESLAKAKQLIEDRSAYNDDVTVSVEQVSDVIHITL
jgi:two-component system alkaline phosphatase synthesis response regulator PhoP